MEVIYCLSTADIACVSGWQIIFLHLKVYYSAETIRYATSPVCHAEHTVHDVCPCSMFLCVSTIAHDADNSIFGVEISGRLTYKGNSVILSGYELAVGITVTMSVCVLVFVLFTRLAAIIIIRSGVS